MGEEPGQRPREEEILKHMVLPANCAEAPGDVMDVSSHTEVGFSVTFESLVLL